MKSTDRRASGRPSAVPKRLVLVGYEDGEDYGSLCLHDPHASTLIKLTGEQAERIRQIRKPKRALELFLRTDLPFVTYHDLNPFDLFDDTLTQFGFRHCKYSDAILERDVEVPNDLGMRRRGQSAMESPLEHHYLPGMPSLVYEDYPCFRPHVEESHEMTNDEFYKARVAPFEKLLEKKLKHSTKENKAFTEYIMSTDVYQTPVDHADYFTFSVYDFKNIFVDKVWGFIVDIYAALLYKDKNTLREYFEVYDNEYAPEIRKDCYTSLKPIGSCAESPFAWGIFDSETLLLNKLWVHVEFVNMCTGIGEGYELVFGSEKKNFEDDKITGAEFTKTDNFLKRFTKCVSICLNSKTRRFIMTDYYWVGCFEIEDVFDGEIEDVRRFISKVKVRHFSYSNFETDDKLTIRNIIASFFYTTPKQCQEDSSHLEEINNRVIEEWKSFQNTESPWVEYQRKRKRMKLSPFIYRTHTGLSFTKQAVDLEKSLIRFIAIGTSWSCQTLLINIKKMYQDKSYLSTLHYKGPKEVLLSIYDEYYQDPKLSMVSRHFKNVSVKFGSTQLVTNAQEVFNNWLLNVEAYIRLKPLQGDVLAKLIDYGYLEDKKYNGHDTHFKCDGYYILYEPICSKHEDLEPIDALSDKHYQLAKEALKKIHDHGVTFSPKTSLTAEVLKVYKDKVFVINLEAVNSTGVTQSYIKKDYAYLDRIFKKDTTPTPKKKSHLSPEDLFMLDDFSGSEDSDNYDEQLY